MALDGRIRPDLRNLVGVEWEQEGFSPAPIAATPPLQSWPPERRSTNWGAIIAVLVVAIAILGVALWFLRSGDSGDEAGVDTAAESTTTTASPTTTIAIAATTTFTTTVPPNADDYGPPVLDHNSTVSTVGIDTIIFGMTPARAQRAAGTVLIPIDPRSECYHVVPFEGPEGIVLLVHMGSIERVDIVSGTVTTRSGVGIGTPEDTVIDLFGDSLERAVLPDGTVDLMFVPSDASDADFRVVFNIADGEVRTYKSGRLPIVLQETGCEGVSAVG